jgi:signal transduction histidine kinase
VFAEPASLLPMLTSDPVQLKYVLYELVTNSLKYTPQRGAPPRPERREFVPSPSSG